MDSGVLFGGTLSARKEKRLGPGVRWKVANFPKLLKGWRIIVATIFNIPTFYGRLYITLRKADGKLVEYGLASVRVVTTAFVEYMVDQLQTETSAWGDFKFHDSGVGVTGALVGNTDIETTDGESRVTGTQAENASTIYESVGTIAYSTTKAITEHGLFNIVTGGVLLDRHTFSAINVENGDSIEFTYRLTCVAGG